MSLLRVDDLNVRFDTPDGEVHAVQNLSFCLDPKESLAIVGESGSGKSQAMAAILGLLSENGTATGAVRLNGQDILNHSEATLRKVRGRRISIVFQDPMTALNPYVTIGYQLSRVLIEQRGMTAQMAQAEVVRMLDAVRVSAASTRLNSFPHEYSGGMRQRVMIAAALLCRPDVLIADEPTTALDVTVQASILSLLRELQESFKTALILITHDLGVVAGNCERMLVLEQGRTVEEGSVEDIFAAPKSNVTQALLAAVPRLDKKPISQRLVDRGEKPLLHGEKISVRYPLPAARWLGPRRFRAVRDVDITLHAGETLGVVGESGCGKSSLARALLRLNKSEGSVSYLGRDLDAMNKQDRHRAKRDLQFVFQDPLGSLDPRMTIEQIVEEPALVHKLGKQTMTRRERVISLLERVGLSERTLNRYPHEFSGGQCQRVGIARALMTDPRVLVCDEAVSALDVTVQASILRLLARLQGELSLGIVFIAHDLAVVRQVCDRVMVMYLGRIVEEANADELYAAPKHPYTKALLDAAPIPDPKIEKRRQREPSLGDLPAPWNLGPGCAYQSRCPFATDICKSEKPQLKTIAGQSERRVACHHAEQLMLEPVDYSAVAGALRTSGIPLTVNKP